jgi:hypothetical protein
MSRTTLEDEAAALGPVPQEDPLKAWRRQWLGLMKQHPAYQRLPLIQRNLVDHLVRKYEHPEHGAFPAQEKIAKRFGVCARTIRRHLKEIVAAEVLTVEPRYRGAGTRGGRTSKAYRLNRALLVASVPQPVLQPVPQLVRAEATHIEAPFREHTEAPHAEAPQVDRGGERSLSSPRGVGAAELERPEMTHRGHEKAHVLPRWNEACSECRRRKPDVTNRVHELLARGLSSWNGNVGQICGECFERGVQAQEQAQEQASREEAVSAPSGPDW